VRILESLAWLEDRIGTMLIYAIILLTSAQVFFRYVLNYPLGWTEEMARYVFIWAVFLGAAVVARSRDHVAVELFHRYLPPRGRKAFQVFNDVCILAFLAAIIWPALNYARYAFRLKAIATEIPMFFVYVSVPVSCFLIIVHTLHNIYRNLTGHEAAGSGEGR
jgi:TRAP-type C4-dicarboxylate transport system permease small subunit